MAQEVDYRELTGELEAIVSALNEDNIDVDDAMQKYARGLEIITALEKYLKTAENKIEKLSTKG
jgi:exodeoxyribonuclease VII small subunit